MEIWDDGVESTFNEIEGVLIDKGGAEYMVAFDTEFAIPDGTVRSKGEPPNADGHYEQLCAYVNRGNLVQVGIGFADERYKLVGGKIFQFNIRFDPELREPDHKGVEVMRKAGLKLEEHAKRGIPAERFTKLLGASGLLGNDKLAWITFMGYIDFGYLIRLLRGKDLPASREHFLNEFRAFFPRSYDCKVFSKYGKCIEEPVPGGLSGVASELGVKREGEGYHQAASDALLALKCHRKLMRMKPDFGAKICTMLYGVQPFFETP
ncbi:unnamed protein product [Urochloa decumbens]|uniref:Uncharacterized protein n=1 Tax=Urochloa decumbens TaxID=240449 RepID=A0ABC8WHC2_9POAL